MASGCPGASECREDERTPCVALLLVPCLTCGLSVSVPLRAGTPGDLVLFGWRRGTLGKESRVFLKPYCDT